MCKGILYLAIVLAINLAPAKALAVDIDGKEIIPSECGYYCTATIDPNHGVSPLKVTFTGEVYTYGGCTSQPTYFWQFGEGMSSTDRIATHYYSIPGTYDWQLKVMIENTQCLQNGVIVVISDECQANGDCNCDGIVSIGEVQRAINMFLGMQVPGCNVDCNYDSSVSVGEVQKVIDIFLSIPTTC